MDSAGSLPVVGPPGPWKTVLESSFYRGISGFMSDEKARAAAEERYYAALDLVAEGHHEQAVDKYQQSLAADPGFTEAMHGLARALQDLNRLDEAIAVANRIAEIDPDTQSSTVSLGSAFSRNVLAAANVRT